MTVYAGDERAKYVAPGAISQKVSRETSSRILLQYVKCPETVAIPAGFEPATLCLEGRCSIQLSYGINLCAAA